jgi:hypothetical protein
VGMDGSTKYATNKCFPPSQSESMKLSSSRDKREAGTKVQPLEGVDMSKYGNLGVTSSGVSCQVLPLSLTDPSKQSRFRVCIGSMAILQCSVGAM